MAYLKLHTKLQLGGPRCGDAPSTMGEYLCGCLRDTYINKEVAPLRSWLFIQTILVMSSHYRMLGLGAHYKPSGTYVFIVLRDVVQKQIVAVELCKPVRSTQRNERAVCSKEF